MSKNSLSSKYKIGIFGSVAGIDSSADAAAAALARALQKYSDQIIIVTGACTGLPYLVASSLARHGAEVWGYSPAADLEGQKAFTPNDDVSIYTKLIYNSPDIVRSLTFRAALKYRNVTSTAICDAGVIISGRWGSLNEFTDLVDLQKVVGVLTGTGGVADELPALVRKISKQGQGPVVFNEDPVALVQTLFSLLEDPSIS